MEEITVVGLWHQGVVAAACFGKLGFKVSGLDSDPTVISDLQSGKAPVFEPGLNELLLEGLSSRLLTFDLLSTKTFNSRFVFFMCDTPVNDLDESDLNYIFAMVDKMSYCLQDDSILVITSQIPVGTSRKIFNLIRSRNHKIRFQIVYMPENLRLGNAIDRFLNPDLPILGSDSNDAIIAVESIVKFLRSEWYHTSLETAEFTKHALNVYIAMTVTFANEIGNICDKIGADGFDIANALRMEPRIGSKAMLLPGLGFQGGTLARDLNTVLNIAKDLELDTSLFRGILNSNTLHNNSIANRLINELNGIRGKVIGVFGLTYKAGTNTLRRSLSIQLVENLVEQGALVKAFDPKVNYNEVKRDFPQNVFTNPYETATGCEAIVFMTPWPEFKEINYEKILSCMKGNLFFDPTNFFEPRAMESIGFKYIGIGRGILNAGGKSV